MAILTLLLGQALAVPTPLADLTYVAPQPASWRDDVAAAHKAHEKHLPSWRDDILPLVHKKVSKASWREEVGARATNSAQLSVHSCTVHYWNAALGVPQVGASLKEKVHTAEAKRMLMEAAKEHQQAVHVQKEEAMKHAEAEKKARKAAKAAAKAAKEMAVKAAQAPASADAGPDPAAIKAAETAQAPSPDAAAESMADAATEATLASKVRAMEAEIASLKATVADNAKQLAKEPIVAAVGPPSARWMPKL